MATAAALAIALIACIAAWLAPVQAWEGGRAVLGFIGRRLENAVTAQRLELMLLAAAPLALEIVLLGWQNSSVFRLLFARKTSAKIDAIIFGIFLVGLTDALSIILTFGISVETGRAVSWVLSQYGWNRIALPSEGALPLAAGFAIYWLLTTFFSYWGHRMMHLPQFWPLHRFHHAATELNMITSFRQHSVEPVVLNLLSVVSPLLFFKVSDSILFIYFLVGTTTDLLAHSQLPWTYGWIGSWVIQSPRFHQVHHSSEKEHRDLNFSNCPLWDRLFGTRYKGEKIPVAYGIPDNQYEERPVRQFAFDAIEFYAGMAKNIRLRFRRRRAPNDQTVQMAESASGNSSCLSSKLRP